MCPLPEGAATRLGEEGAVDALVAVLQAAGDRAAPAIVETFGTERMRTIVSEVMEHVGPGALRALAYIVVSEGRAEDVAARLP